MIPLVTVLMPVYNAERFLVEALNSIISQTYRDFELLIINDGSTDRSLKILDKASREDSRIRLVSQSNQGIVAALNHGLSLARGEFIARMDADDIAMPERLEQQLAYLKDEPKCVAVGSQVILIDPDGDDIGLKPDLKQSHSEIDTALMVGHWPIVHPSVMMRTEAVRGMGGYRDFKTWEDHDLFLRLAEVGNLCNFTTPLLRYRLHLGSIVHQRADQKVSVLAAVLHDARCRRGLPALDEHDLTAYRTLTPVEHLRNWVWWALADGNIRTARKIAMSIWRRSPLSLESYRLLYCAARGC